MPQKQHIIHGRDHLPGHADPIPGFPSTAGDSLADLILAVGPDAFWKLNETSGVIAYDSSGNHYDLTATSPYSPPSWGSAAGPPGETTAYWPTTDDIRVSSSSGDPALAYTDNFTAGVWVNIGVSGGSREIMGQGTGGVHTGNGWAIAAASNKFTIFSAGNTAAANSTFTLDTWYFVAAVRDAGTWKLYLNGLLQTATISTSPGTSSGFGGNTWLGNDNFAAPGTGHGSYLYDSFLSYAFIVNHVLTGAELLAMYEAGISGGLLAAGLVWTSNGSGGASWETPTLEVDY